MFQACFEYQSIYNLRFVKLFITNENNFTKLMIISFCLNMHDSKLAEQFNFLINFHYAVANLGKRKKKVY